MLNHSFFKSLLFFGAGAVLTATGERDMDKLGGLIHRMPFTSFAVLVGCVAISALPPFNGFVSEWLIFQAVLQSPELPQWALKIMVPAVGAMLALAAALAAACFVKTYGVTFLGRPRGTAAETAAEVDRYSLAAMFILAALCLLAGILPGLVIDALAPVTIQILGSRMPVQAGQPWLSIVPIAESRSSYNGLLVMVFITVTASLAVYVIHRFASRALRRGPAWGCGFSDATPAAQYSGVSFAQPIRRVFGTLLFHARDHVEMPPPGDIRPARLRIELHDLVWSGIYAPIADAVGFSSDTAQPPAIPDHPAISQPGLRHPRHAAAGARDMVVISDIIVQGVQMLLVLLLAPLLTGYVRKIKARLVRRQGASVFQPYRDLLRLLRKEVVLADNASWLFRVTPYITFAAIWVAAALVPTFATGLLFNWTADLIAIVALLGSARFFLALAGMDVGTSFGGIGSSREVMIAALAEPAMLLIVFCLALVAGSTQLSTVSHFLASSYVGLRVSLGMALVALFMVAIAENARIPVDNPATHLELTMVHEAMILEYSGRHLAMIELGAFLKLLLYVSLIACVFFPWQIALYGSGTLSYAVGAGAYVLKLAACRLSARAVRDRHRKDAGVSRPAISRRGLHAGPARHAAAVRLEEFLMQMHSLAFDISHTLAGGLVLISLMMLYQDRLYSLLNVFALHALVLSLSVAWQAFIQDAPHLYVTAVIALVFKAIVIPVALHRIVKQLGIHRDIESAVGIGPTMLAGMGLVALSLVLMLRVTSDADPLAREDLAFALSVVLLGLLVMVTRRNAVSQVVGFMSLENGLVLAATGAKGMPLVVEISVAFSILIAFIVIGIFLFRIRERFDSVDVSALDDFRGERR